MIAKNIIRAEDYRGFRLSVEKATLGLEDIFFVWAVGNDPQPIAIFEGTKAQCESFVQAVSHKEEANRA